jgi:PAS domain S-box-containing protein
MTGAAINVLVVEDNPTDVLLLQNALEAGWLDNFTVTKAEQLSNALGLLAQEHFDIALLDLGLPDSQGFETFMAFQRQAPDLPVVVFSGNEDEQEAIRAVRAGAQDYVIKSPAAFDAMVRVIRYAIERHKLSKSLKESEEQYRFLLDNTGDFVARFDRNGVLVFGTEASRRFHGYELGEILHTSAFERIHPDDIEAARNALNRGIETGNEERVEYRLRRKSGEYMWVEAVGRRVFNPAGEPEMIIVQRDITARKQAETEALEARELFQKIFTTSPIPIALSRISDRTVVNINTAMEKLLGYTGAELIGKSTTDFDYWAEPQARQYAFEHLLKQGTLRDFEFSFKTKTGVIGSALNYTETFEQGAEKYLLSIFVDITERKQADEKLRESEAVYRRAMEAAGAVPYYESYRENGSSFNYEFIGAGIRQITGYEPEEFNMQLWDALVEETHPVDELAGYALDDAIRKVQNGEISIWKCEHRLRARDGSIHWVFESAVELWDARGNLQGSIGSYQDITARKEAEEKLRESEARYRGIFNSVQDAIFLETPDGTILDVNQPACEMYGYSHDEFVGKHVREIVPVEEHLISLSQLERETFSGRAVETINLRANGEQIPVDLHGSAFEFGGQTLFLAVVRDITERKQAEAALAQRLAELELLYQSGLALNSKLEPQQIAEKLIEALDKKMDWHHVAIRRYEPESDRLELLAFNQPGLDNETQRQVVEQHFNTLVSNSSQGLSGWAVRHRQMVRCRDVRVDERYAVTHPDIRSGLYAPILLGELAVGVISVESEEVDAFSDSDERLLKTIANQAAVAFENARLFQNLQRELTERRQAQEKLRQSEERYRTVADFTYDWEYWVDPEGRFVYISPSCERLTGYTPEAFLARPDLMREILHPEDRSNLRKHIELEFREEGIANLDYRIITASGETRWFNHVCQSVHGADGKWLGRRASNRDITDRKQAEQKVQELQEFSTATIDALSAHLCVLDEQGNIISVNRAWEKFAEANPPTPADHYLGANYLTVCDNAQGEAAEEAAAVAQGIRAVMKGELEQFQTEYPCHAPWEHRWFVVKITRFAQNGAVRIALAHENITARKQAEENLRESEERFKSIFNTSPVRVSITRFDDTMFLDVNDGFLASTGYRREEVIGHTSVELQDWVEPGERLRLHKMVIEQPPIWNYEARLRRKSGEIRDVLISADLIELFGERCILSVGLDITERKQADIEAANRQQLLEKVLQLGKNVTAIADLDACLREIHQSIRLGLGFDRAGIFLYDVTTNIIQGVYGTSRTGALEDNSWYRRPVEEWTNWQIALQSPNGISVDKDYQTTHNPSLDNEMYGVREHVTLPAWAGEKPVALITVDNLVSHRSMSAADLEALQLFAGYAGLAIANAQLHAGLEQRVRERTAEVQDLYDKAPTGYHSLDVNGNIVMMNQTELDWLGYTRAELIGQSIASLFTPASLEIFQANFPVFKQRGWVRDLEIELVRKDGSIFPALVNATAIQDKDGNYLTSRTTVFDITEHKKAEEALRESEETYRALFETANDAIFLMERSSRKYVRVNPRGPELLGFNSPEELIGRDSREFVESSQLEDSEYHIQRLFAGERSSPYESAFIRADGTKVEVEINLSLIRDNQREPKYLQSVVRDITLRKRAAEALHLANRELERAMRMKDEFLASMSHELRTPLTGILGLSEALQLKTYGELNEKQLKALTNIESGGRHLLELINDILDLSKIEAGKLELQIEPCSLGEICQASLQLTKGLAQKKHHNVSFSMNPAALIVRVDHRRLKQMLVNLLSNAIKFTPEGGSLGLEVLASEQEGSLSLTVWDKGVGIAADNLSKLFKPFVQLDSGLARQHSGTGLGLSLVQRMAELHGGSVKVESQPNEGSRFTIVLPWSPLGAGPLPSLSTGANSLRQSLMVNDSEIDVEQITRYLQHLGIVNAVHSLGVGAVEAAVGAKPGVILLDLQLPDASGLDVLEKLKSDPRTEKIPVVICSVEESRSKATMRGAAGYLVKPFTLNELRIELARVIAEQKRHESVLTIAPPRLTTYVMIVDDNEVTLETLADFLTTQQFHVTVARSGVEALKVVPEIHPDIILMDIQMPGMDGLEATRQVRAHIDPLVAQVPIVALTALAMPGDREICLAAGANEYLSKPVPLQKLATTIRQLLGKAQNNL